MNTRRIFFTFVISLISFDQIADNNVEMTDSSLGAEQKTISFYVRFHANPGGGS